MTDTASVTSAQVRDELLDLVSRDLVGPWNGPTETILGTPRARYLAGALAPISLLDNAGSNAPEARASETSRDEVRRDETLAVADLGRAHEVQGVPVEDEDAISEASPSDNDEDRGPESKIIAPSSMGIRFQVDEATTVLRFVGKWGKYESRREADETGRVQTYYDRTSFEVPLEVDVSSVGSGESVRLPLATDVELSVEVFAHEGRRVVEAALLNVAQTGKDLPPRLWLFQAELEVTATDGASAVFLPTRDAMETDRGSRDKEVRRLDLLYRDRLEFAVGRTASATWSRSTQDPRRAIAVRTTWLPTAEVPQTLAPSVPGAVLGMRALVDADPSELETGLRPLIDAYDEWLRRQLEATEDLPEWLRTEGALGIDDGERARDRLRDGLKLLTVDIDAQRAFRFMNRAMLDQRIRSQISALRIAEPSMTLADATAAVETLGESAASWRAFQLAFILMQLPAVVDPAHVRRSSDFPRAELLFFPTGGGKTEAYLGLAAFTFGIRRLKGVVETPDGPLDGGDGVTVLMRYTLRLLTSQQFLRATTLMCAAELIRLEDPTTWGEAPFRIGLWVGSSVSPKRFAEAAEQIKDVKDSEGSAFGLTVLQFNHCPWCGTPISPRSDVEADTVEKRVRVYCGDKRGICPFSSGGTSVEGLPVLTVDDEIYRHPPTFLLATVDKFARLAREGEAASLFGYVTHRCPRHGYKHADTDSGVCGADRHNISKGNGRTYPATQVQKVNRLRPPDLIIQDELHLITGALGTAVGLFEGAVDVLSSWEIGADDDARPVKPLIVASTATVRKAGEQVQRLYARAVEVFPPQVLSVSDTFFSKEVPLDEAPGRLYLGACLHGARLTLAEIRLSEILLLAGQRLFDAHGAAAEPYLSLVDYFSATRELAGMRRYLEDDVSTRVSNPDKASGYPRRRTPLRIGELTSRISSSEIGRTLTHLGTPFDADLDTTAGRSVIAAKLKAGEKLPDRELPFDVVLATSMLQVGVDVPRLGLMMIVGQPKNTAEYIQASSRVGRDSKKPGLVVTLANRSRPRDMAHYEQFEHYHDTFYANVEALSVTPFSDAALERGLTMLLVSAARVFDATTNQSISLSPDAVAGAGRVVTRRGMLDELVARIIERIERASDATSAKHAEGKLVLRLDEWAERAVRHSGGLTFARRSLPTQHVVPLLISPEDAVTTESERLFQVANSMREVQPEIDLLVSPFPGKLAEPLSSTTPGWTFSREKGGGQ
jgi:hypothetical protein